MVIFFDSFKISCYYKTMKKFLVLLTIIGSIFLTTAVITPENASADCRYFLGLTSWDCNVSITSDQNLKTGIWGIASNIATDITVIAAYLVLGYVIYGGYLYTFSGGDPGKIASGKKTLFQAFIGLAIVMAANLIMGSIRIALVGGQGNIGNCATAENACVSPDRMITNLINWFIAIAGVVSAIFLVYGGVSYITSAGEPSKTQKAKQMILYSLIGLVIVGLSIAITAFVSNIIRQNTSYLNQTIISKEVNEIKIN